MRTSGGKVLASLFAAAFLGWMVLQVGLDATGRSQGASNEVGRVDGRPLTLEEYNATYQQIYDNARRGRTGSLSADEQAQLREQTWQTLVERALLANELQRRHITVSDDEIAKAAQLMPPPDLAQNELFQTNGQFDLAKYQTFLRGPTASPELFARLEAYYREQLPQAKLVQQVGAGAWVSDQAMWRAFRDRNETATVEYVSLDLSRLAPNDAPVTDAEISTYYDAHKDDFKRTATARLDLAYIPIDITAADTAATLQHVQQLRAEIAGGADFAEVARRESKDPASRENGGDLGTFQKGQMVGAFDSAAFSLPLNQVSQPIKTQFGYHLIQVLERSATGAHARHILIPVAKADEELQRLDVRADSMRKLAPTMGLERAARLVGAVYRPAVTVSAAAPYVPAVGSAREGLDWAAEQASAEDAPRNPVSDAFQTPMAEYVVRLVSYQPKGTLSLADATPQIRRTLIVDKKKAAARAAGQRLVPEIRGGKTLQQVAAANGLTVGTAGPFGRLDPNPVFGQASAAVGAAFGTPIGQVSNVVETTGGLFIIRPTARTQADARLFAQQKDQLRQLMTYQSQQEQVTRWMASLRRSAKIQDFRDRVFRGRAS
ncbi:MAG TPA: peptidylprolyl isomerase [Longimicrobiaceae bacterium]|nr:peptidylprolyl isomerase [Longimicrobiaceae bacterium]